MGWQRVRHDLATEQPQWALKVLGNLSADGGLCSPSPLFSLRCPNTDSYRLLSGSGLSANEPRCQLPAAEYSQICQPPVSMSQGEPRPPPPLQETLQDQKVGLVQVLVKLLHLPLVPVHARSCMCHSRAESLLLPIRRASAIKLWWPSKPNALVSHLPGAGSQAGEPDLGLRTPHSYGRTSETYLFSNRSVAHITAYRIYYIASPPSDLPHSGSFFMSLVVDLCL